MTKKKPQSEYEKNGRPTVMTDETIRSLEEAFSLGCSDTEACIYADISTSALYEYQKRNPDFTERKALLKEKTVLLARQNLIVALKNGDDKTKIETAKWYLERKRKDEFSTRVQNENRSVTEFENMSDDELGDIVNGAIRAKDDLQQQ